MAETWATGNIFSCMTTAFEARDATTWHRSGSMPDAKATPATKSVAGRCCCGALTATKTGLLQSTRMPRKVLLPVCAGGGCCPLGAAGSVWLEPSACRSAQLPSGQTAAFHQPCSMQAAPGHGSQRAHPSTHACACRPQCRGLHLHGLRHAQAACGGSRWWHAGFAPREGARG
jgi:hypothetical protein